MEDSGLLRYSRHIMLPQIDVAGQERLCTARVMVIGVGGLGSPASMYLAAAGVGELVIVDYDAVDLSNLQRQIAHTTERIGWPKTASAEQTLTALNPTCQITAISGRLEDKALLDAARKADVVLDCSDNFATRFAVNAACVKAGTPLVSGAAMRWEGQVSVFTGQTGEPCYQCLYASGDGPEDTCTATGVVAPLVGIIGSVQAVETIKLIAGAGQPLVGRLLILDALDMTWRTVKLRKDLACPVCNRKEP